MDLPLRNEFCSLGLSGKFSRWRKTKKLKIRESQTINRKNSENVIDNVRKILITNYWFRKSDAEISSEERCKNDLGNILIAQGIQTLVHYVKKGSHLSCYISFYFYQKSKSIRIKLEWNFHCEIKKIWKSDGWKCFDLHARDTLYQ